MAAGAATDWTTMRILVVEADKKVASFLEKGLREEGYSVDVAHLPGKSGGRIALAGVAAEIGVIMLLYLGNAWEEHKRRDPSPESLRRAVIEGAALRVRPIVMTVTAIVGGLIPIFWGHGAGATVMRRIAAPMVGGMLSATLLTLLVIPVPVGADEARCTEKSARLVHLPGGAEAAAAGPADPRSEHCAGVRVAWCSPACRRMFSLRGNSSGELRDHDPGPAAEVEWRRLRRWRS